jgi:hypothetical protein
MPLKKLRQIDHPLWNMGALSIWLLQSYSVFVAFWYLLLFLVLNPKSSKTLLRKEFGLIKITA